jgi:hypothetical protein
MATAKSEVVEIKEVNFAALRGRAGKKGGPKMKVYAENLMKTKGQFSTGLM